MRTLLPALCAPRMVAPGDAPSPSRPLHRGSPLLPTLLSWLLVHASAFYVQAQVPVITSFSPRGGGTGETVIIQGTNFSPNPASNIVQFGGVQATVLTANEGALTVRRPTGAAFAPISVTANGLVGVSQTSFVPTFPSYGGFTATSYAPMHYIPVTPESWVDSAVGDLDNDGLLDLALLYSNGIVAILRNQITTPANAFSFAPAVQFATGSNRAHLLLMDMNGDGRLEILVDGGTGPAILPNDSAPGTVSFQPAVPVDLPGSSVMTAGDFDRDGKPDLAVVTGGKFVSILINQNPAGQIQSNAWARYFDYEQSTNLVQILAVDLDTDGWLDLAGISLDVPSPRIPAVVKVLRNHHNGVAAAFAPAVDFVAQIGSKASLQSGDIDGDGKSDLMLSSRTFNRMQVWRNVNAPGSIPPQPYGAFLEFSPQVSGASLEFGRIADLDGDGRPDVVEIFPLTIFRNLSSPGTFTNSSIAAPISYSSHSIYTRTCCPGIGDFNGDGKPDIALMGTNFLGIARNIMPFPIPRITNQPESQFVARGTTPSLSVGAFGAAGVPLSYQWLFNGAPIPNAVSNILSLTNVQTADSGNYSVIVSSIHGSTTSSNALVTVGERPVIVSQPSSLQVAAGSQASFTAGLSGTPPFAYEWRFGGQVIPGATGSNFLLLAAQTADIGNYSVVVTNRYGTTISSNASLLVTSVPNSPPGTISICDQSNVAEALNAGGAIKFACDGVIRLTRPLVVTNHASLDADARKVVLSGLNQVRLFRVASGIKLDLKGLTLADGMDPGDYATNRPASAGGILNAGELSIVNCTLSNLAAIAPEAPLIDAYLRIDGLAAWGGAIMNQGSLLVSNSVFIGCRATGGRGNSASGGGSGGPAMGGAIFSTNGLVRLVATRFLNNTAVGGLFGSNQVGSGIYGAARGAALYQDGGTTRVEVCEWIGNGSTGEKVSGGAIHSGEGWLSVKSSLFVSNRLEGVYQRRNSIGAPVRGGAIHAGGRTEIMDSTLDNNSCSAGNDSEGGALFLQGTAVVSGCTLSGNSAAGADGWTSGPSYGHYNGHGRGGGLANYGTLFVTNCTFFMNRAIGGDDNSLPVSINIGADGFGGAIYHASNSLQLVHITVVSNRAIAGQPRGFLTNSLDRPGSSRGGGLAATTNGLVLQNSILAFNGDTNTYGPIIDAGRNISSDATPGFGAGSWTNTDPRVGSLGDNGGPTLTVPLLPGSPAIDAADCAAAPPVDQRGRGRPSGTGCDVGAFEEGTVPSFAIRGRIAGAIPISGIRVSAVRLATPNPKVAFADASGGYELPGLSMGTWRITPDNTAFVSIPAFREASVGPDQVNIDFQVYRRNAVSVERISAEVLRLTYAGTNGQTVRMLSSTNLTDWIPLSTGLVGPEDVLAVEVPFLGTEPGRFYRFERP